MESIHLWCVTKVFFFLSSVEMYFNNDRHKIADMEAKENVEFLWYKTFELANFIATFLRLSTTFPNNS